MHAKARTVQLNNGRSDMAETGVIPMVRYSMQLRQVQMQWSTNCCIHSGRTRSTFTTYYDYRVVNLEKDKYGISMKSWGLRAG